MKKSKKAEKELYNNKDLDTKPKCGCGNTEHPEGDCDGSHLKTEPIATPKVERKMINRKAVQADIDIDKSIRRLLRMGYYNYNQIASMIKGANLERVKQVDNERRKT
jgi:CDGSH-type Zn-finger protein